MNAIARLWAAIPALLLAGCAATAMTLMQHAGDQDAVIPTATSLRGELKGRAFEIGDIRVDHWPHTGAGSLRLPDSAYIQLLDDQLRKAFAAAGMKDGNTPLYKVNSVIEIAKFTGGGAVIPVPSMFQVLMTVERPDGSTAMRGRFKARGRVVSVPVTVGGVLYLAAIPLPGGAVADLGGMVPAMADTMTRVAQGLRNGTPLDAIQISWQDDVTVIQPAPVLRDSKLGMRQLSGQDIARLIGAELR